MSAVSRQCSRETSAASRMKSARAVRPSVFTLPGAIRNTIGASSFRLWRIQPAMSAGPLRLANARMNHLAAVGHENLLRDFVVHAQRQYGRSRSLAVRALLALHEVLHERQHVARVHLA